MTKQLGRKYAPDDRDRMFMAAALTADEPLTGYKFWWDLGGWFQQGWEGTCVGWNGINYLEDSPVTHPAENFDGREFYAACCNIDEWTSNDWTEPSQVDYSSGTSVRAFAKVCQSRGLIGEYRWAWQLNTVLAWLRWHGPVLMGTTWWNSMFDTRRMKDARGTIRETLMIDQAEGIAGGHCWILNGVNFDARIVRGKLGSWPRDEFGADGRCAISFDTLDALIQDAGEAMMAIEVK